MDLIIKTSRGERKRIRRLGKNGPIFVVGSFVAAMSVKVARLPLPGETLLAEQFLLEAGGKGLNLLVGLRRLGHEPAGVIGVGSDLYQHLARETLLQEGLPLSLLACLDGPSGSGVGIIDARGENLIAVFPGANQALGKAEIDAKRSEIEASRLLVAQFEASDDAVRAAFDVAHRVGVETLLSPSPYRSIGPEMLACIDHLVMNETEAQALSRSVGLGLDGALPMPERYGDLLSMMVGKGVRSVVVTFGSRGALGFSRDAGMTWQPAFPIEAADGTGAGDSFLAGYVSAMVAGLTLPQCLERGAACGAVTASRLGVLASLPDMQAVDQFLATQAGRAG
jgi:ribokinase